jgi:acetylornithine deacetylase/succinyl-diaminopimelate desuccinylase-like protein
LKRACVAAFAIAAVLLPACRHAEKPVTDTAADQTRPAAEWLREEPVRLLSDYVRIETTQARGERLGAEFLQRLFACDGIENEIVCPAPERCNVLARLPGRSHEGALLLLNHIDVVDAFPRYWKEAPPFEGRMKLGYLYGRGVYDMKSFGLAQALAMRRLKRLGIVPRSDILFLAEADEEMGQRWGSRWLLEHRPEWFRGVRWVINEGGTTELILREPRYWGIETLQAGFATAELEAPKGEALTALASRVSTPRAVPVEPHPQVKIGFDMLANHLPSPYTDPLRHLDRVARNPAELAILPDRYASFLVARVFWSPLYQHPASPENWRCYVSVSTPPGMAPHPFIAPILEEAERRGLRVVSSFESGPTFASDYPSPMTDLLERVTEAHYPGVPFGPLPGFGGYTTSLIFRRRGFQTYGYSPFPMNVTDAARRHSNDERIYLRDYLNGAALFADVVEEFALSAPR